MKRILFYQLSLALASLAILASNATAAVVVTSSKDVAPDGGAVHDPYVPGVGFVPSSSDLVEGLTASHNADDVYELSAGSSAWTNGSVATVYGENGPGGDAVDHAAYGTVQSSSMVTFDLGGLFNLSQVDVYPAWNDSGRDDISFDLQVSTDDLAYSTIANYTKGQDDTGTYTTPVTNYHSIADDGGADIASAVRYVRLQMTDADNGSAGIAEIDVFGTAIPEPTSIALGVVGLATLMLRRRV